jgi:hypothetical protein
MVVEETLGSGVAMTHDPYEKIELWLCIVILILRVRRDVRATISDAGGEKVVIAS